MLQCATQTSFLSTASLLSLVTAALCAATVPRNSPTVVSTTNRHYQPTYQHGLLIRANVFLGQSSVYRQVDMHCVNARLGPHFIGNYLLNYVFIVHYYILTRYLQFV